MTSAGRHVICSVSRLCFYRVSYIARAGVHVSRLETLELARAKSIAEVMYSTIALVLAAVIGGQGEIFSR